MSDHAHAAPAHAAPAALDFEKNELAQFDKDDTTAGTAIGRMLAVIFLYTIFAMGIAGWWTYSAMTSGAAAPAVKAANH